VKPRDDGWDLSDPPAFIGDTVNQGLLDVFASDKLRLTLKRPTTGRTRTVDLGEGPITRQPPAVTSKTLPGGVTYVQSTRSACRSTTTPP